MYCSKCGFKNIEGAVFCEECGSKLKVKKTVSEEKEVATKSVKSVVEEKKQEEKNKGEVQTKTEYKSGISKSNSTIAIFAIIVIIVVGAFFCFNYQKEDARNNDNVIGKENSENQSYEWGMIYYDFLKDLKTKEDKSQYGIPKDAENITIKVYQAESTDMPVMLTNYKENEKNGCGIYFCKDNQVNVYPFLGESTIEKLYNVKKDKEQYIVHSINERHTRIL